MQRARVLWQVTRDVLVQLYSAAGCEPCASIVPYYNKVAERLHALGVTTALAARLDVKAHGLPRALSSVRVHNLPTIIVLPARRKQPPHSLFHGSARPKELLYFLQAHASYRFELPPNPHLTREQHTMWKEQVQQLPREKVERAYQRLFDETGLQRDEL